MELTGTAMHSQQRGTGDATQLDSSSPAPPHQQPQAQQQQHPQQRYQQQQEVPWEIDNFNVMSAEELHRLVVDQDAYK